jgi:hypothetical protein
MDAFSDLDFFVVVEAGHKQDFLEQLDWLSTVSPLAYAFANTKDGYKALFADGVFCEFGVFEEAELETIPFAEGRMVWKQADAPDGLHRPMKAREAEARSQDFLLGEALTNLYVGLGRVARGEMLSAMRLIQVHAVDRVLELLETIETPEAGQRDPFALERRFEQRYPGKVGLAAAWAQGYGRSRESALALLEFLEQHFELNAAMVSAIHSLSSGFKD